MSLVEEFKDYRVKMNDAILEKVNRTLKRLFSVDHLAYAAEALAVKTKEFIGLVASMVLRCDDCVKYHLGTCDEIRVSTEELYDVFSIANLVGGPICIPHTSRAAEYWEELQNDK